MNALAQRIVNEGLSVRNVEEIILIGQGKSKKKSNSNKKSRSDSLQDLVEEVQERLGDALDTRVTISGLPRLKSRGTIVIEAADAEDLRRIADAIAGPAPRL
jgi:ParB family chromosome partitioning protein